MDTASKAGRKRAPLSRPSKPQIAAPSPRRSAAKGRISQPRPEYLPPERARCHLVRIPYVETSGVPGAPFAYVNGLHAALHSILAALRCDDLEDVRHWLDMAGVQLCDAAKEIRRPGARPVPDDHYWSRVEAAQAVASAAGFEVGLQFPPTDDLRRLEAQKRLAALMQTPDPDQSKQ